MAIFHAHAQVISRGQGRNAVSAAAYRSASTLLENIIDPDTGISCIRTWDYSRKNGVVLSQVFAPNNAPSWAFSREELWNYVEHFERRKDAQLAREFDIALPVELSQEQNCALIEEIALKCFVSLGMIADVNVHYDNPNNPHAHVMLTLRELVKYDDGRIDFGLKQREWNSDNFLASVRTKIANIMNWHLSLYGHGSRVSHLSHKERGIDLTPTMHIGPSSKHMKSLSDRRELNERIVEENYEKIRSNPELVLSKLSINKPVFTKDDIASSLDKVLSYNIDHDALDRDEYSKAFMLSYSSLMSSKELTLVNSEDLKGDTLYALTKRVTLENRYEEKVRLLAASNNHSLNPERTQVTSVLSSHNLSEDQLAAIHGILAGPDISILEGIPGSGKTFVMGNLAKIYKEAGYNAIGSAPSSAASLNLEATTSIASKNTTLLRKEWQEAKGHGFDLILPPDYHLLAEYQDLRPAFSSKTVLIVDEASMSELTNMDYMLSEVIKAKAKVIFVGDNNQYQAVGFQGALNKAISICGEGNKLSRTQRQIKESHRLATEALSQYKLADAMNIYLKENAFRIKDNKQDVVLSITHDYITEFIELSKVKRQDDLSFSSPIKSIVIVSHANESVDLLNCDVRKALALAGSIKGRSYQVRIGNKELELAKGDQIVFKQNNAHLGVLNGELGNILSVKPVGDEGEGRAVLNVLVHSADGSKKKIEVDTGSSKYLDLTYGYAVTGYTLQGGSADKVLVNFEPECASYESFNVMMTRHRSDVSIYASKEELENVVYRSLSSDTEEAKSKFELIMKNDSRGLWEAGFISSISRRANLSFAKDHSYDITKLSTFDQVIKTYLEARSEVISYLKAIEDSTHLSKEDDNNSLWLKITKSKGVRNKAAKTITEDYDSYKDRLTQLGINHETILKASGSSPFSYSIEQKSNTNSIAHYTPYRTLIETLQNLRSEGQNKLNEEHTKTLKSLLTSLQDHTFELKLEISTLEKDLSDLEDAKYTKTYLAEEAKIYVNKLFPAFLSTVYKEQPSEVLAKYHALLESNNNDSYITSKRITENPEILGSLKGLGFGTMLKLNTDRKDAALGTEVLQKRFKKYRDSLVLIKASDNGDNVVPNYKDADQDLSLRVKTLSQNLPNTIEEKLIEEATKVLNSTSKHDLSTVTEFISSNILRDAIFDYYSKAEEEAQKGSSSQVTSNTKPHKHKAHKNDPQRKKLSFASVSEALISSDYESIFRTYAHLINPDGKITKHGNQISSGSLNMNLNTGLWHRFSNGESGDIFSFVSSATHSSKKESLEIVASASRYLPEYNYHYTQSAQSKSLSAYQDQQEKTQVSQESKDRWVSYEKVPDFADEFKPEEYLTKLLKVNTLEGVYAYRDKDNKLLGYTIRIKDKKTHTKQVLPVCYARNEALSKDAWRLGGFTPHDKKPIYGLEKLTSTPDAALKLVLIVEGEKTADATQTLFPEYAVLSWIGGVNAVPKVDWSVLQNRKVIIWPDNDILGKEAASGIASLINKSNCGTSLVSIIDTDPLNLPNKWDLADNLPNHLKVSDIKDIVEKNARYLKDGIEYLTTTIVNSLKSKDEKALFWLYASNSTYKTKDSIETKYKLFQEIKSVASNPEITKISAYLEESGKLSNPHPFLNYNHPLYQEMIATAIAQLTQDKRQDLLLSAKENPKSFLEKTNDLYVSIYSNDKTHLFTLNEKYLNGQKLLLLRGREQCTTLLKTLMQNYIAVHQIVLCSKYLSDSHIEHLSTTITKTIEEYNSNIKNPEKLLTTHDLANIASRVHSEISSPDFAKSLTEKQMLPAKEIELNTNSNINKTIKSISKHVLEQNHQTFTSQNHTKLIKSLEQIEIQKAKAKSPKALFVLIQKEQTLLLGEFPNLATDAYANNPSLAGRIETAHESSNLCHIQNLEKSLELVTSKKLLSNKCLLNTLKNADESNIKQIHDGFVKVYQKAIASEINRGLDLISDGHTAELDGKHFTDELSLLHHIIDHHGHKPFFPTKKVIELHTKIEKEFEAFEATDHHHTKVSNKGYDMEM